MPQTLYHAYKAILQGLIDEAQATAAVLVLADSAPETPHILAQVGGLAAADWTSQLKERPPDIFVQPLSSTVDTTALLGVHVAGQTQWSARQQSLIRAAARSIEFLSRVGEAEIDWEQLIASHRILPVTEEELCRIVLDIHDGPVQKIFAALNRVIHLQHLIKLTSIETTDNPNLDIYGSMQISGIKAPPVPQRRVKRAKIPPCGGLGGPLACCNTNAPH